MSNFDLALRLFLQIAVILCACRLVGIAGRYVGQTQVVSEIVAGVLLGPSLLGLIFPGIQTWLFPQEATIAVGAATATVAHPSMSILYATSQVGIVLYMFLVGLEFNPELLRGKLRRAGVVSTAGIAVPFLLGAAAAYWLSHEVGFFRPGIQPWIAAMFLGASMSITAFPVLARIIHEKGIAGTHMGTMALAAGSFDDAIAWCLLAIVLASVDATPGIAVLAIAGAVAFTAGMVVAVRPLLGLLARRVEREDGVTMATLMTVLAIVMAAAWLTDYIRIYAVFGAFITGAVMPRGRLASEVHGHIEFLTTTLLVPLFFVFSGLNTSIGLMNTPWLWTITGVIVLIAVVGKGAACTVAARVAGEEWRDAAALGTLMNARGLMELVILNIGLQAGIIRPTLFSIMVVMAIVTTVMTSPLFTFFYAKRLEEQRAQNLLHVTSG